MNKIQKAHFISSLIGKQSGTIFVQELQEKYMKGKVLGDKRFEIPLGQLQAKTKDDIAYMDFLKDELRELIPHKSIEEVEVTYKPSFVKQIWQRLKCKK